MVRANCPVSCKVEACGKLIPWDGSLLPIAKWGCAGCTDGSTAECQGYLSGFDDATTNALCASEEMCEYICDNVAGCESFDMHATLERCFLNYAGCDTEATLVADDNYVFVAALTDPN